MMEVLVVGGSFAAREFIFGLKKDKKVDVHVTLVSMREYMEYIPSALRCMVDPDHALVSCVDLKQIYRGLEGVDVVIDKVTSVSEKKAVLESGRELAFDYCVLATGSTYNVPIHSLAKVGNKIEDKVGELLSWKEKLTEAKSVLILGGGITGVELVAEIVEVFPKKSVTIVSKTEILLPGLKEKAGKAARAYLEKRKVRVLTGGKAEKFEESRYHFVPTGSDPDGEGLEVIDADLVIPCFGGKPNSEIVASSFLNERHCIRTDKHLAVKGTNNSVFAIGDVADHGTQAFYADAMGVLAAKNVCKLLKGEEDSLLSYPVDAFGKDLEPTMAVVSLGKYNGILCMGPIVYQGLLAGILKTVFEALFLQSMRQGPLKWVLAPMTAGAVRFVILLPE